jgi:hypothetical protein
MRLPDFCAYNGQWRTDAACHLRSSWTVHTSLDLPQITVLFGNLRHYAASPWVDASASANFRHQPQITSFGLEKSFGQALSGPADRRLAQQEINGGVTAR